MPEGKKETLVISASRPNGAGPAVPRGTSPILPATPAAAAAAPGDTASPGERLLEAVARTAERFLRAEDWAEPVQEVLADIGEATGVGRVYIFENHRARDGTLLHSMRWEWCAPGVRATFGDPDLQDRPYPRSEWKRWFARIEAGETVFAHHSDEASEASKRAMTGWGIVSIAVVPIHVGGSWWGYMAYDDVVEERPWADGELEALRAAAGILGAAIERDRARSEGREAEARYRALVEQIPSVVYTEYLDGPDGEAQGVSYMSPQVTALFGYTPEEWLNPRVYWDRIVHPDDRTRLDGLADRSIDEGVPWHVEYRIRTADGAERWVLDDSVMLRGKDGEPLVWQGTVTDISAAKGAQAERRKLLARVVEAQEEERRRIASDVHDDQIQKLTAVSLRLQTFRRHVEDPTALEDLDRLERTVGRAIEGLRHLLFELRPKLLDDAGLSAALTQYCRRAELESGIEHLVDGDLESEPSAQTRGVAYRIAQEALTNARRHANPTRITVRINGSEEAIVVRVIDDGDGFEEGPGLAGEGHLGLSSMRERAELAGGTWQLRSSPGRGTTVEFRLPVQPR
ncbi:MAG: PAS domain-containing protein [Actinomycetota bacterium]